MFKNMYHAVVRVAVVVVVGGEGGGWLIYEVCLTWEHNVNLDTRRGVAVKLAGG